MQLERGELGSRVQLQGLEPALAQLQGMVNRIAVSILVGALVIGLSQFIHMVAPVGYEELAARFFGLSFLGATVIEVTAVVACRDRQPVRRSLSRAAPGRHALPSRPAGHEG